MKKMLKNLLPGATWEMLSLEEALCSLEEGAPPTPSIENLSCILHKCRKEKNITYALRLHAYMRASGLESNTSLGNELVPILVEVGCMCNAQQVFDTLIYQNDCLWTHSVLSSCTIKCNRIMSYIQAFIPLWPYSRLVPS